MSYGDYNGPDKDDKGIEGGSCNRSRCQSPDAIWYNHGSMSWYCEDCREEIEFDSFNLRDWRTNYQPRLGHPMFETREMMDDRKEANTRDVFDPWAASIIEMVIEARTVDIPDFIYRPTWRDMTGHPTRAGKSYRPKRK